MERIDFLMLVVERRKTERRPTCRSRQVQIAMIKKF